MWVEGRGEIIFIRNQDVMTSASAFARCIVVVWYISWGLKRALGLTEACEASSGIFVRARVATRPNCSHPILNTRAFNRSQAASSHRYRYVFAAVSSLVLERQDPHISDRVVVLYMLRQMASGCSPTRRKAGSPFRPRRPSRRLANVRPPWESCLELFAEVGVRHALPDKPPPRSPTC
jgi:hypothetical protein